MPHARQRSVRRFALLLFAATLALAGVKCSAVDPNPPDPHNHGDAELKSVPLPSDASAPDAPDAEEAP